MAVEIVRAVDGGGAGFRRGDVQGREVKNIVKSGPINDLKSLFSFVGKDLLPETEGIAYAMAGDVEQEEPATKRDLIHISPNAHFLDGVCLSTETAKAIGLNSDVSNDMEGAVTGMAVLFPDEPRFLGITWSSGIGARYWRNGIVCSAEVGHIILDVSPFAALCGDGKLGHAEAIIGGDRIRDRVLVETGALGIEIPEGMHPCDFLRQQFKKGEPWAVRLCMMLGRAMGFLLANVRCCYDFPLVVWKGTFAFKTFHFLKRYIRHAMMAALINPDWASRDRLRFQMCPVKNDEDALIGAAQCFLKYRR